MQNSQHTTQCLPVIKLLFAITTLSLISVSATSGNDRLPTGRWRGEWRSESTGHHGPLRARVRQLSPTSYRAIFSGRFFKVIPFIYPTKLSVIAAEGETQAEQLESIQKLPFLGTYRMEATVTSDEFKAKYESRRDVGTFNLSR